MVMMMVVVREEWDSSEMQSIHAHRARMGDAAGERAPSSDVLGAERAGCQHKFPHRRDEDDNGERSATSSNWRKGCPTSAEPSARVNTRGHTSSRTASPRIPLAGCAQSIAANGTAGNRRSMRSIAAMLPASNPTPLWRWCPIGAIRRENGTSKRHKRAAWLGGKRLVCRESSLVSRRRDAEGGTRTHTRFPPPDFESGASTGSATSALLQESTRIASGRC